METLDEQNIPEHIAIIMDGNRRWAKSKNLSTKEGHTAGGDNLENVARICDKLEIKYLTVYAFSTENWKRSKDEVSVIMSLFKTKLEELLARKDLENVKIKVIGDREGLSSSSIKFIEKIMKRTENNTGLNLNIAFNYGGRNEITNAVKEIARKVKNNEIDIKSIDEELISNTIYTAGIPDPDLIIRTSNELRTSNFLPWQGVYSELYFTERYWPDFNEKDLILAIQEYQRRNRRFGAGDKK